MVAKAEAEERCTMFLRAMSNVAGVFVCGPRLGVQGMGEHVSYHGVQLVFWRYI